MACKGCIKIKSLFKPNKKPKFSIKYEVDGKNKNEIKDYFDTIKHLNNELIEDAEKNEELEIAEVKFSGEKKREDRVYGSKYRLMITTSKVVIVRIFEAMYKIGVISAKTPIKAIAELFFVEISKQNEFTDYYYSTKNQIKGKKSGSTSDMIIDFIVELAVTCLRKTKMDILIDRLIEARKYMDRNGWRS